jgi:hypothetical protein
MKVYGITITPEQLEKAADFMQRQKRPFRLIELEGLLIREGVPHTIPCVNARSYQTGDYRVASRAADRILQKARKAGEIVLNPNNKQQWITRKWLNSLREYPSQTRPRRT